MMQQHGLGNSASPSNTSQLLTDVIRQSAPVSDVKSEPINFDFAQRSLSSSVTDDLMEDMSPVIEDPMMSSSSPNVLVQVNCGTIAMEEVADMLLS